MRHRLAIPGHGAGRTLPSEQPMLTLYSQQTSGNAYNPRLLMALLGIPFRIVEVNTYDGSTRRPAFLAKNPIGKVPLLEFEDGRRLAESNAILLHLAEG